MFDILKIVFAIIGLLVAFIFNNYSFNKAPRALATYNSSPIWHSPHISNNKHHTLPVVYLQINTDDFFSCNKGIYVRGEKQFFNANNPLTQKWWDWPANYHARGKKSEREVHFNFTKQNFQFSSPATVKIHGNKSRAFPQKSLAIKFTKKKYNPNIFNYSYGTLILRNSGNDWGKTLFADALAHQIMMNSHLDAQPYKHVVVYLNNEYWGIHNLTVKTDEHYLAQKYNYKKKHITVIESEGVKSGSDDVAQEFYDLINKLQSNKYTNNESYELIKNEIDLDNFNAYIIFQIYFANTDWPHNNLRIYKVKSKNIFTKWCFIPYDMDYCFAYTGKDAVKKDMFQHILSMKDNYISIIFSELIHNRDYVQEFNNQFQYYLNNVLNTSNQLHILDSIYNTLTPEIAYHINRWRKPATIVLWNEYVKNNREFILNREKYIRMHLDKFINYNVISTY